MMRNLNKHNSVCFMSVGGAGGKMLSLLHQQKTSGVRYIAVTTDSPALISQTGPDIIPISRYAATGLGSGGNPHAGEEAVQEKAGDIADRLQGVSVLILLCGLGGGVGSGASPVIAKLAREMGIFTIAVTTLPFFFEGEKRNLVAANALKNIFANTDFCIAVDNNCFWGLAKKDDKQRTLTDFFRDMEEVVRDAASILLSCVAHAPAQPDFQALCQSCTRPLCESMFRAFGVDAFFLTIENVCTPTTSADLDVEIFSKITPLLSAPYAFLHMARQGDSAERFHLLFHFEAKTTAPDAHLTRTEAHHASGDFIFDDEPSQFLQRNTGGPYDSGIWFSTPLPAKEQQSTGKKDTGGTKAKVLPFPKNIRQASNITIDRSPNN